jgi:hypothetical protein
VTVRFARRKSEQFGLRLSKIAPIYVERFALTDILPDHKTCAGMEVGAKLAAIKTVETISFVFIARQTHFGLVDICGRNIPPIATFDKRGETSRKRLPNYTSQAEIPAPAT